MSDIFVSLESKLSEFVARRTPEYLRDVLSSGCFVYGAGGYGRRILSLLKERNIPCAGIIDQKFDVVGQEVDGVPALHPDTLRNVNAAGKCLVVGVHNHLVDPSAFLDYARSRPFREVLWNADLPDVLGGAADNYWLTNRQFMLAHFVELKKAAAHLADHASVELLAALVQYRVTGDVAAAPVSKIDEQYFPPRLLRFDRPITFVDGGAYDGDTYRHLAGAGVAIDHWIAFEPDPKNFLALTDFSGGLPGSSTLFPCGLSDGFRHMPFAANAGPGSHLGHAANRAQITVPCVALDDVMPGLRPDYIKLDIEGAERTALNGMRKTIAAGQPHLAVSIYHRPQDLWDLVPMLVELAPYSDLHLRQHCLNAFDTVLYAVRRG